MLHILKQLLMKEKEKPYIYIPKNIRQTKDIIIKHLAPFKLEVRLNFFN